MEAHNERQKEQYKSNPDIDTAKSADNYHLIQPQHRYYAEIMSRVEVAKCRVRKDSVLMIEALITASPEFMSVRPVAEQQEYFERALTFMRREVGEKNVFAATVHMDERNPHMHVCMVPITPDKRLSAKDIMGNQKMLSEWQTKFHEHMSARWNELERGASAMETHRKHIPVWLYKKAQHLDKQAEKIKQSLEDITVFNAGKKREEALNALTLWLPEAERFTAQVKGTQDYINQLVNTSSTLSKKLSEKEERFTELSMEAAYMRHSLKAQQRLLDRIPREVMEELKRAKGSREMER
jgi:hypothetical protein